MSITERGDEYLVPRCMAPRTVLNVGVFECRWVTDQATKSGLRVFCGKEVRRSHRPYCDEHYPLVYVKTEKKSDDAFAVIQSWFGETKRRER